MDWIKLFNDQRRKSKSAKPDPPDSDLQDSRTQFERDHDRILFSTPFRRMANKTQVFPFDPIDSIRTRLTHSIEVSNLCRSLGTMLAFNSDIFPEEIIPKRNVSSLLAAIGLAHDLGNPPFGHQGEKDIRSWFKENEEKVFAGHEDVTNEMKADFFNFDGNAQTTRLLTRLQLINDNFGLNLTYGTLAALMKYTVPAGKIDEKSKNAARKKLGYFQSEKEIVKEVLNETGIKEGERHPLTYLMEACDDIAYSVLDAEDSVKKGLVSYSDLIAYLNVSAEEIKGDQIIEEVVKKSKKYHHKFRKQDLSPSELNDISMQMFRVFSIATIIREVTKVYLDNSGLILGGKFEGDLIQKSKARLFVKTLKEFDRRYAFNHPSVLEIELRGHKILYDLMNFFWKSITNREDLNDLSSDRLTKLDQFTYSKISENYRRTFESNENLMPMRYKEAQLLTDMVSGMTDTFAESLYGELKTFYE